MNTYPTIKQGFGIFGIAIGLSIAAAIPYFFAKPYLDEGFAFFLIYVLTIGGTFLIAHKQREKYNHETVYNFRIDNTNLLPIICLVTIAIPFGVTGPITSFIPMNDFTKEIFLNLSKQNGIFTFLSLAIAAPLLEELIFRGIVLDGFLKRYSPTKAILASSFLFGLLHLNPQQFVTAMIIGSFMGWIYYRTKSLGLTILIHMLNNSLAFIGMQIEPVTAENIDETMIETYGGLMPFISITGISIAIIVYGLNRLNSKMSFPEWITPEISTPIVEPLALDHSENAINEDSATALTKDN